MNTRIICFVFASLLFSIACIAADQNARFTFKEVTKVFSSPKDGEVITTLGAKSEVTLLSTDGLWAQVQVDGWVLRSSLSETSTGLSGVPAGHGFSYSNVSFLPFLKGESLKCIGEITNETGKSFQGVMFALSAYDASGKLLNNASISIREFGIGETRSFDTFIDTTLSSIPDFKIQYTGSF